MRREVVFIDKEISFEKNGEKVNQKVNYKDPEGKVHKAGEKQKVTGKQAVWLAANGFIEVGDILKKENKEAAKRKTK